MTPDEIKKKMLEIRTLPDDWDSYGSKAPCKEVCDYAQTLALMLPWVRWISQTADEGIVIAFETVNDAIVKIEIEFYDGKIDSASIVSRKRDNTK